MTAFVLTAVLLAADPQPPAVDPGAFHAGNEELAAYLLEAARANPALEQRYAQWQAALERVPQAASLDDPTLSYGQFLLSDTNRFRVAVAQKFPWFGTLRARSDRAAAEAEAAWTRLVAERNRVYADVKRAWFDYAWLRDRIAVTEAQLELLVYIADVAESRLSLGLAYDDEVLRVSMTRGEMQDRLEQLRGLRPVFNAELAAALGRADGELLPWPQDAAFAPEPPAADALVVLAHTANPDLAVFDHLLESRRKAVELARKKGYPGFTLGVEFVSISKPRKIRPDRPYPATLNAANRLANTLAGNTAFSPTNVAIDSYALATSREPMAYSDGGDDNLMVSLTVNVPLWRKKVRAGIAEARHLEHATAHEQRRTELDLAAAVRRAHFEREDAIRRQALYGESLLPQARQTYESLQERYAAGFFEASFIDVMESVDRILQFELERVRAVRDRHVAEADLEYLAGGTWAEPVAHDAAAE